MKKQSDLSRLMGYAGNYRYFTYASWVLSAVSALVALVPFVYIWKILRDVLNAAPDYAQAVNIPHYGWMAVLFAVLAYLIYIAALMCSHLSAFRVATNLRLEVSEHLATLPLGFTETFGSGKLRKIIHESTGAAETFLAHQLPDKYNAMATPIGLLVLLLVFDWRLGLLSLVPVALGFVIMSAMTGRRMADKMRQYGNALESMSNEAVEYVRGIPVVKTFGQSVFSFKKFKATIDEYEKWVIAYTKELRMPMMLYTAAINGVFAFLIVGGLLFTRNGVTSEFLLNLLFYIIITPVISLTLTRIMYMSENELVVADALARVDSVLDAEPVPENDHPRHPKDASVSLKDVHFSYDGKTDVIKGVSLKIQPGQMVAFVGPSGGGKSTLANLICRFFDVQSGSVRVGGADVRDIPKEELMDTIAREPKIVKYIDLPLQHCSGTVLRAMRRFGNREKLTALIQKMRARIPGLILRTTMIAGFPGETEEDFAQLCAFIKEIRFERLGCFAYSQEEDTPAAEMENQIEEEEKRRRADRVMETQMGIMQDWGEAQVGKVLDVLTEGFEEETACWFGRSYADAPEIDGRIYFTAGEAPAPGQFVRVRITACMDCDLMGEIVG